MDICPICEKEPRLKFSWMCLRCHTVLHKVDVKLLRLAYTYSCSIINGHTNVSFPVAVYTDSSGKWSFSNLKQHPAIVKLRSNTTTTHVDTDTNKDWNTTCDVCGSQAYIGLFNKECSNPSCKG